jgi:hypothetical protein
MNEPGEAALSRADNSSTHVMAARSNPRIG